MPVSGTRIRALYRRANRIIVGFHKTVHLERVEYESGSTDYRPGSSTVKWSYLVDPRPLVYTASEEDINESGNKVSLGDYIFDIAGDTLKESDLRAATHIVIAKGKDEQEIARIVSIRIAGQLEKIRSSTQADALDIVGGKVIKWKVFTRATKLVI